MNLKPYPEYKDSGVAWLGNVPKHWKVYKIRNVANLIVSNVDKHSFENENKVYLCNYTDVYKNEKITNKIKFMKATASEEEIRKFKLRINDVVITKDSESWNDIGVPALVLYENQDFICGYHLAILRTQEKLSGQYLFRLLQDKNTATQFHRIANGVTRYGMSQNAIKDVKVLLPSLSEQITIARFLDYKTAQIARFIKAKKRMIELLKEQKQVIINDAVTGRIDVATGKPYPKYKDSGVEWLGQVPEGWEMRRLKFVIKGKLLYGANSSGTEYNSNLPRYIRITDFTQNGKLNSGKKLSLPINIAKGYYVKEGDILFARSGATVGKAFQCKKLDEVSCFAGYLIKAEPDNRIITSDYLYSFTQSLVFLKWKNYSFIKATIENIGADKYSQLIVSLPPLEEQHQIVSNIETKTVALDLALSRTEREIALIQEYRTRLISDVVTGKIDVRNIKIPDVTGFDDTLDESIDEPEGEEEPAEAEE